ncbi:S1 RNA-binding domain-containing protein [Mesomycoplasma lagogenitalium]|uniref:S1 RNA-binding domain-containing protein n=1 Tax=Mesomycoplasma lagogenitalium TaxID=171286 RepID=A0ABY8LX25_9BACT|nr:S1 RNA-binding domain-containing protein [Mesomycoplasma lagogenitalium]WGI36672.1 S1 RNA-binding domain-containing protein [Mesomycoplasma lagogenitalium]
MKNGDIVTGKVKSINKNYFWVDLPNDYQGVVFIQEVSDYYIKNLSEMFVLGDEIKLKVLSVSHRNKKASLSFKAIRPKYLKIPFTYKINETKNGFENLFQHAKKEVEKWRK